MAESPPGLDRVKLSKLLFNFYLVISNKERERTPSFQTFWFPFRSSKSDVLRLMAPITTFSYLTLFAVQNRAGVFLNAALFVSYRQNSEIELS